MSKVKFSRYDTVDYLRNEDDVIAYIDAAVEDGDPALITAPLGDVARTHSERPEMGSPPFLAVSSSRIG